VVSDIPLDGELVVTAIETEAAGVICVELADSVSGALPRWEPGAHLDLIIPPGLERQYSLCGDPDRADAWRVAVLREPDSRGGSAFLHEKLRVGDRLTVRGPRNKFPVIDADQYLFIAGGIGITPLVPMVERLAARGTPWRMLYGGRTRASMAFVDRLSRLGGELEIRPEDEFGLLDLGSFLGGVGERSAVYACGPEPLIQAVEAIASDWAPDVLRVERFRPREGALAGPERPFTVVLDRSGLRLEVAAGQTILQVVEANDVDVPTSCREGTCGTCETAVLEGIPDHRDSVLTESERARNDAMMICCSRARSDTLVLDL
jgi:ferredoxin-NADP reductase